MAASGVYKIGEQGILGAIDLTSNTIKARLLTASYTPNFTTDTTMTSVGSGVGTDSVLSGITVTNGVFNASVTTFTAPPSGNTVVGAVVYKFTTNDSDSIPIVYIQLTSTITNGGDLQVNWSNSANKIFTLS